MPRRHKALGSSPSTTKTKKKKRSGVPGGHLVPALSEKTPSLDPWEPQGPLYKLVDTGVGCGSRKRAPRGGRQAAPPQRRGGRWPDAVTHVS